MRKLVFVSLCVLVAGCAASPRADIRDETGAAVSQLQFPADQREVTLPVKFDGALLFADDVRVNGQHVGAFVIDTGAPMSVLDREAATKLGLTPDKRWREIKKMPAPDGLYRIESLDVGGVGVRNHVIAVLDLSSVRRDGRPHVAGVICADVWAMMPFTVDYRKREVVFHDRERFRPPPRASGVESSLTVRGEMKAGPAFAAANPRAGAPSVPVRINGEVVDAVLDTASGSSLVLMPQLVAQRPHWVRGNVVVARAAGAGGAVGLAGLDLLAADIEYIDALGVRFTDIHSAFAFVDEMPRRRGSAILGSRLLSKLRLTFDYSAGKVWAEWKYSVRTADLKR